MSIQYTLYPNTLTDDPRDCRAQTRPLKTADLEQVVERMLKRGSTTTKADILAVLNDYREAIGDLVVDGWQVVLPEAHYFVSLEGVFTSATDEYDPARHRIMPLVRPGPEYRRLVSSRVQLEKRTRERALPTLVELTDVASGTVDSLLTPGGQGRLVGERLRFDPADPAQGIFFVPLDAKGKEPVAAGSVGLNMPGLLVFVIPPLAPGEYRLQVRAVLTADPTDLRTGDLGAVLTVPEA